MQSAERKRKQRVLLGLKWWLKLKKSGEGQQSLLPHGLSIHQGRDVAAKRMIAHTQGIPKHDMSKRESNSRQSVELEWLDLRALIEYAAVSERTIREWIHRSNNPLPAAQVGNKLLVKRRAFDEWLAAHKVEPSQRVDLIVSDVMRRMRR
jgi:excisionase family DNA binding protein